MNEQMGKMEKQKRFEDNLRESEERSRSIFENNLSIHLLIDPKNGNIVDANSAACEFYGYSPEQIKKMKIMDINTLPREEVLSNMKKVQVNKRYYFEFKHKMADGQIKYIEEYSGLISTKRKELLYSAIHDITERKMTQLKAEEAQHYADSIIATVREPMLILDKDLRVITANRSFYKIFKVEQKQTEGVLVYNLGNNQWDIPGLRELLEEILPLKNSLEDYEVTYNFAAIGEKTMLLNARKIYQEESKTEMILLAIEDITERKQSELALAAEKEQLAITLRSIGDGVITTDTKGNIVMLNKAAEALTGWNSNEAFGHPLLEVFNIINENTRKQWESPANKVLETDGIVELANNSCLIAKDGREIVIADSGAPIHDKNNKTIGVVLVFRDTTEKQKLEDSMQKTEKLESLGVLAGGIAHDFNNLLGGIYGYTEMAIAETMEEEVSNYLSESLSSMDRARALTQQLLTFARGGTPIKRVEDLFPFLQKNIQFVLSGSSVSTSFEIDKNLWPCNFDRNQIGQVFDNLTINAQQSMPNGGTIEVFAQNTVLLESEHLMLAPGNYVKLSITDQGIGISKESLPSIFDPYYTTKPKGHGLGLATCYSIINRHDGIIDVESESGKGSTFSIYLPATIDTISTTNEKPAKRHTGSGTFLVMDDEKIIRELMKKMLGSLGYTVVLKENGQDTIDFFTVEIKANRKIAGMIFDLTIPGGMGGKETIKEIRKICSNTPVFVSSGYSDDPIIAHPEEYGFNASIRKPFMLADLSEMLEKHRKIQISI